MNRLKELRKEANATQADMAKILGVTVSAYGNYELGQREPTIEFLCKLADYFNVSVDYLIGHETKKGPIMERPLSNLAETFIQKYSDLFSEKSFHAYAELYRYMDERQKIFVIGMIVGYLKENGVNINITF